MTEIPSLVPEDVLSDLPKHLRSELLEAFGKIVQNYRERRWEPSELNGGKLCEVVYSIAKGFVDGKYPSRATKPKNILDACRQLESVTTVPRSVQILIPRLIPALYEVRNNRGVGHRGAKWTPTTWTPSWFSRWQSGSWLS